MSEEVGLIYVLRKIIELSWHRLRHGWFTSKWKFIKFKTGLL